MWHRDEEIYKFWGHFLLHNSAFYESTVVNENTHHLYLCHCASIMNLNLSQKWQTLDLIWFAYIQTGVMAHMKIKCCPPPCQTQTASNFTDKKKGSCLGWQNNPHLCGDSCLRSMETYERTLDPATCSSFCGRGMQWAEANLWKDTHSPRE